MAIAAWQPGTVYLPGSLVVPTTVPGAAVTTIPNANLDSGDTGWTKGTGWAINTTAPFAGTHSAEYTGTGADTIINATKIAVAPGKAITAQCFVRRSAAASPNAAVILVWYTAADAVISTSTGNAVTTGGAGIWKASTVSATAPPTAAKVSIGATATSDGTALYVDNFQWNYITGTAPILLAYKAIQAEAGISGATEPTWPTSAGGTVVDNDITWEAQAANTVTWEASSVLTSGSSEPTFPTEPGSFVSDNNIAWKTSPLWIEDENCPHTKVVAIAASKVFAAGPTDQRDVVRFCATLNARDWTSEEDAGFLPTGLQQKSQVGADAMGVYRGNLCVWSASTFQVWQVDPDPAAMALLDAMEGIGTMHQQAVQPVSDDLFFLAALGVRSVSIGAGTNNLAAGDIGLPIDILVQAEVAPDVEPIATYYPSAGQYWLAFRDKAVASAFGAGFFLLTSTIYPIEVQDEMSWTAVLLDGVQMGVAKDSLQFSTTPLNSTLEDILLSTGIQHDDLEFSATPLASSLDTILLETGIQHDDLEFSCTPLNGTLEFALVSHENPEESLDWTAIVTGGTLT